MNQQLNIALFSAQLSLFFMQKKKVFVQNSTKKILVISAVNVQKLTFQFQKFKWTIG